MNEFLLIRLMRFLPVSLLVLSLVACSTLPEGTVSESEAETNVATKPETAPVPETIVERELPERPKIELTEDIMFKVLLAEVAGQRGKIDIAVERPNNGERVRVYLQDTGAPRPVVHGQRCGTVVHRSRSA